MKCEPDTETEHPPLLELPDPLGRYASLITQYNLREATVVAPNVREGDGNFIRPHEYNTKLATSNVVLVECQGGRPAGPSRPTGETTPSRKTRTDPGGTKSYSKV